MDLQNFKRLLAITIAIVTLLVTTNLIQLKPQQWYPIPREAGRRIDASGCITSVALLPVASSLRHWPRIVRLACLSPSAVANGVWRNVTSSGV